MRREDAENLRVGDVVMVRNDASTYLITGIRNYETMIIFETDGGEIYHKSITDVLN